MKRIHDSSGTISRPHLYCCCYRVSDKRAETDRLSTGTPSWPALNSALLHSIAMRASAIHVGELRSYTASTHTIIRHTTTLFYTQYLLKRKRCQYTVPARAVIKSTGCPIPCFTFTVIISQIEICLLTCFMGTGVRETADIQVMPHE